MCAHTSICFCIYMHMCIHVYKYARTYLLTQICNLCKFLMFVCVYSVCTVRMSASLYLFIHLY